MLQVNTTLTRWEMMIEPLVCVGHCSSLQTHDGGNLISVGICWSHRHSGVVRLFSFHQFEDGVQRLLFTLTFEPLWSQLLQSSVKLLVGDDPRRLLSAGTQTHQETLKSETAADTHSVDLFVLLSIMK